MKNWKDKICFLFPLYWIMNAAYSKRWNATLLDLLSTEKFQAIDQYTAKLGKYTIWIGNHPYSSFTPYEPRIKCRPSRSTIRFAMRRLMDDLLLDGDPFPKA